MEPPTKRRKLDAEPKAAETVETLLLKFHVLPVDLWYHILGWAIDETHVPTLSEEAKVRLSKDVKREENILWMGHGRNSIDQDYQPMPVGYNGSYTCDGIEFTYRLGLLHSYNDEPAVVVERPGNPLWKVEYSMECSRVRPNEGVKKIWMKDGKRHRVNGLPAVIFDCGTRMWYQGGVPYRPHGLPTYVTEGGILIWLDDEARFHRDGDLPAVIDTKCMAMYWHQHGRKCRENGEPMGISRGDCIEWYIEAGDNWKINGISRETRLYTKIVPRDVWCGNGDEVAYVDLVASIHTLGVEDAWEREWSVGRPYIIDDRDQVRPIDLPGVCIHATEREIVYTRDPPHP